MGDKKAKSLFYEADSLDKIINSDDSIIKVGLNNFSLFSLQLKSCKLTNETIV